MSTVHLADDGNFETEVLKAETAVLVDFSASWCGPCKKLEPIVHEIAGDYAGRLKVVKVDVDRAPSTAARFGILSVPTVLVFRGGAVKGQHIGLAAKRALADLVEKALA